MGRETVSGHYQCEVYQAAQGDFGVFQNEQKGGQRGYIFVRYWLLFCGEPCFDITSFICSEPSRVFGEVGYDKVRSEGDDAG